jgi:two-component system, NarL family, sensor histidine kinase UhpB
MSSLLRILHLEDTPADAELVERTLKRAGMKVDIKVVDEREEFESELRHFKPDVILSDHTLPQFNSIEALKIAKASDKDIPFILITGTVSEEFAVECLRSGANDYILKSNLIRLPSAIRNALSEKNALVQLRNSEEKYRLIVETAQEGIWMFNRDFETVFANRKMCEILEYEPHEMIEKRQAWFVPADAKNMVIRAIQSSQDGELQVRCNTRTGRLIWLDIKTSPIRNNANEFIGMLSMVTDVTEKKLAHEQLVKSEKQIRNFAQYLNKTMEAESARIAREIHDELGQQLASIKMSISALKRASESGRAEKIESIVSDVDHTIQSVRKIATELRPGILDTLGLVASIEWLGAEFERKTGVKCEKHIRVREAKFPNDISVCFFRICQESLTNITKHAQARKVAITLEQADGSLRMLIADDGKGIAGEELENPFSMGLLGMKERARAIDAALTIQSSPNKGTTVELVAPVEQAAFSREL